MQILKAVQKSFDSLGFSPKQQPFNHRILITMAVAVSGIILLWIFLLHEADSSQAYMESIYVVTACSGIFLSATSTIFIKEKLFTLINSIDEQFNERLKNPALIADCKINQFVEKYTEIGIFAMKNVIIPCFILPKVIVSFFIYFTTDLGNDAFDLPIPIWFPFDWKNPAGYLVAVAALFLLAKYPFQYIGCFVFLAFGVFIFTISFVDELKNELHSINQMANDKKSRRDDMYKKLSKFIQSHAIGKQISVSFLDLYETTLTLLFVGCIITMCVAMLLVQIEISHNEANPVVLLEAVVFGVWSLIVLLFVCELGQRYSNVIEEIDKVISQLDWYLLPGGIQRVLPIVMQSAQKPAVIKCFGNVLCARKQFRKVVKTIYSYFMVLREFYK